ncbi:SDR family NAD(P)-dependent oxidoreductase [Mycobacterium sp.]|uniref:SDR family NAD(P)-dependent oxidoreductase n=1 Tax=Mycobacterium sp. TaxID=1785 RepID=UPI003C74EC29
MGQVSVVTGGAGGMGLAAPKIIGRDRTVVIADVRQDRLDAAAAQLAAMGIDYTKMRCDITDRMAVAQLAATAAGLGTVTSVIHTAGVSPSMASADIITKINAIGTVNVNEVFYELAGPGFAIVNVASMAAHMMPPAMYPTRIFATALSDQQAFLNKATRTYRLAPKRLRPGMAYSLSKTFVRWYCTSQAGRFGQRGARILSVLGRPPSRPAGESRGDSAHVDQASVPLRWVTPGISQPGPASATDCQPPPLVCARPHQVRRRFGRLAYSWPCREPSGRRRGGQRGR